MPIQTILPVSSKISQPLSLNFHQMKKSLTITKRSTRKLLHHQGTRKKIKYGTDKTMVVTGEKIGKERLHGTIHHIVEYYCKNRHRS